MGLRAEGCEEKECEGLIGGLTVFRCQGVGDSHCGLQAHARGEDGGQSEDQHNWWGQHGNRGRGSG